MTIQQVESYSPRASFSAAVTKGIEALMEQCGYSRDRATTALMRELCRGDSTRPSDEDIFNTMTRYNLGIEEATKLIIVSRALRREMQSTTADMAIESLTSRISVNRLLYESSEDENENVEDEDDFPRLRTDLRVRPISKKHRRASKSTPIKARLSSRTKTSSRKQRKRSMEEMTSTDQSSKEQQLTGRSRAQSVSEEVSAKIAKQNSNGQEEGMEESSSGNITRKPAAARSKRATALLDDESLSPTQSSSATSNKRIRNATDA